MIRSERDARDPRGSLADNIPFYLIGLLLTATALAKLWMLLTDSFADVRIGIPKEILWLSVAFELWLAFANFRVRAPKFESNLAETASVNTTRNNRPVMAFNNTIVFGSFAIFASVRLAMGYGSCGCSGSLELPAWIFILLDFGIVAWFARSSSRRTEWVAGLSGLVDGWRSWSPEARGRLAGLAILGGLVVGLQLPWAAPLRAMVLGEPPIHAVVRIGETSDASPKPITPDDQAGNRRLEEAGNDLALNHRLGEPGDNLGEASNDLILNRETLGQVEITNLSSQPAKIIGMSRSCRCFELAEDPISKIIPANERISFPLVIKPKKAGPLHQRVVLFLDHPKQFRLNVDVLGSVKGVE